MRKFIIRINVTNTSLGFNEAVNIEVIILCKADVRNLILIKLVFKVTDYDRASIPVVEFEGNF
jgi:hypothetical protein